MKKFVAIALLLSGISFATLAQETSKKGKEDRQHRAKKEMVQKSPEEMAKYRTERLDKQVKLTDKQRQEVYALNLKNAQAKKTAMESRQKENQGRRNAMKATQAQLNQILTPEQQKIVADKMAKNEGKKFNKRDGSKRHMKNGERPARKTLESPMGNTSNS